MTAFRKAFRPLAFVLSCAAMFAPAKGEEAALKIEAAVDKAFRPLLDEHDVAGMAVAVTVDGKHHFFSYGVASKDSGKPVTQDTLFEIGSVSKTFAATLATYAEARGALSLDDAPGAYMPALRGSAIDKASLLNLGTYTAGGLPLQFPDAVGTDREMEAYFRNFKPTAEPGVQRRYSNPSIGLFGDLTARALKGDYASLVETELFAGLGLANSFIRVPKERMDDYALGYSKANKPVRVTPAVFDAEAYGVKTSAADLIRFVDANIAPENLEPSLRRAVEGTQIGYFKIGGMVQGLGWEQYAWPVTRDRLLTGNSREMAFEAQTAVQLSSPSRPAEPTLFNKTGSTNGFGAYAAFVPAEKIGIVMLANRNVPIPARVSAALSVLEELSALRRGN